MQCFLKHDKFKCHQLTCAVLNYDFEIKTIGSCAVVRYTSTTVNCLRQRLKRNLSIPVYMSLVDVYTDMHSTYRIFEMYFVINNLSELGVWSHCKAIVQHEK